MNLKIVSGFGGSSTLCEAGWGEAPDEPVREDAHPAKLYHYLFGAFVDSAARGV